MDQDFFDYQIERLRSQWRNSYGTERVSALWRMFRDVRNDIFSDAISQLIVNQNFAPLAADLTREVELARSRDQQSRAYDGMNGASFLNKMNEAAKKTDADKEYVKRCMETLGKKLSGEYSIEQFNQACNVLEEAASVFMTK